MKACHSLILATVLGLAAAGCAQERADRSADKTREAAANAADATKNVAERVADKTKEIAGKTADKTGEIAGTVATKTKKVSDATAEVVTDGWITTKITAKFADETILEGSRIDVDTKDKVVTLKGRVRSAAARTKATSIASGTKGVTRVVNQIVVK